MSSKLKKNIIIKAAGRTPAGWSFVEEYEADPIASDSDDWQTI